MQDAATILNAHAAEARQWLFTEVLPAWWTRWWDPAANCFRETLGPTGEPQTGPRRIRNQARQTFAFARAGRLQGDGPWREAAEAGFQLLVTRAIRADGGTIHALDSQGRGVDQRRDLYDVACVLLALAEVARAFGDRTAAMDVAQELVVWCETHWRDEAGGFREGEVAASGVRLQNSHMHLLEAFMALYEASGDARYLDRANAVAALCVEKMFDALHGVLPEYFGPQWVASADVTVPGHAFEWSWLFAKLKRVGGRDFTASGARLALHAETSGVAHHGAVIFDEVSCTGVALKRTSRLWPHTERVKASLARLELGEDAAGQAVEAWQGVLAFCQTPLPAVWLDRRDETGRLVEGPAQASSLYHVIGAVSELCRVTGR